MALPTVNPVEKTATEIRRSIGRLEVFRSSNPGDKIVVDGIVSELLRDLKAAYDHIPDEHKKEED